MVRSQLPRIAAGAEAEADAAAAVFAGVGVRVAAALDGRSSPDPQPDSARAPARKADAAHPRIGCALMYLAYGRSTPTASPRQAARSAGAVATQQVVRLHPLLG